MGDRGKSPLGVPYYVQTVDWAWGPPPPKPPEPGYSPPLLIDDLDTASALPSETLKRLEEQLLRLQQNMQNMWDMPGGIMAVDEAPPPANPEDVAGLIEELGWE